MPDDVVIMDVTASLSRPTEGSNKQERQIDLAITVENHSPQKTYQMISSERGLGYDRAMRTLTLSLKEPEVQLGSSIHLVPPILTPVLPGESVVLQVSVPTSISRMTFPGGKATYEEIDMSNFERVTIILAYDEIPFRPVLSLPPHETLNQLHHWGRTIEKTFMPNRKEETLDQR
jgi:hypothetical protein